MRACHPQQAEHELNACMGLWESYFAVGSVNRNTMSALLQKQNYFRVRDAIVRTHQSFLAADCAMRGDTLRRLLIRLVG